MKRQLFDPNMKRILTPFLLVCFILMASCRNENRETTDVEMEDRTTDTVATRQAEVRTFRGDINAVNTEANRGTEVSGNVSLRVEGDLLRFTVEAEGLAPDMMHIQHLQASQNGGETGCPDSGADANNDGIIDVTEISPSARGIYMIPLHMGPSSLEMNVDTYPRSNVNGELAFQRTVSLDSLRNAVQEQYGMNEVDFTRFTYVIQGVSNDASIPQSAQTVSGVDMHQSIPVGCAKLEEE